MRFIRKGITRGISLAKPYVETILPEGHRLVATIGEITPGPTFSIRKFPARPYTLKDLVEMSMLDYVTAAYLWLVAEYRGFIIISGPMGSGKTTLLSAIASMLPKDAKIVTIEDTPEIKLPHKNWVRMFTREGFDEKIEIGMFSLVKLAVRYRPDYIIVGEVRGDEVHAMFQAAALGHGMLTTFHASTIEEFITRLTTPPLNINIGNLQLVWCIVFTSIHNGVRKVVNIVEPYVKNGQIHFNKVFDEGKVMIGQSMKLKNLKETYSIDIEEEVKRRIELIRSEEAQPHPSR
ncbi:MAG: hypothetical protein B6V02_03870 [Thermoprotei archaeon ex4572_64]|nr:MAG: hypothetical protein B6V02_03870 [Thermoprotei archaeon ex4572_64]